MKTRFPLYAKILLLLLLNLFLLGAVFYTFFHFQFKTGLDSLMMAKAGERLIAVGKVIAAEMKETADWNSILQRFGAAYNVRFYLFNRDGSQGGGEQILLPPEVLAKVMEQRGMGMGMGMGRRGPPPGRGPNRFQALTNAWPATGSGGNHSAAETEEEPVSKFLIRSLNPAGYWMGVCLPNITAESGPPPILLAMAPTLQGGLFPDLGAWLWIGAGGILCSALFWLPPVRGITRCITQMTRATEQIAEGRFDTRLQSRRRDELGRLGQAIDRMSARLEGFVTGQKRFMGDVAHELCSPLARMQVAAGILEEQATEKLKPCVADIREDMEQMSALINELLSFSKASLNRGQTPLQPIALAALIRRVIDREQAKPEAVVVDVDESVFVAGDSELLSRALGNIVRNALRYAGHSGPIQIGLAPAGQEYVTVAIADSGPGVPEDALEKIFDPFFRVESSRCREAGGVGLGLAIVKTCVDACQGTVKAANRKSGGLVVEVTLKKSAANQSSA